MTALKIKNLGYGKYETLFNDITYRIEKSDGMWNVKVQEIKNCDYWFTVGCEASRVDALRLIEDGYYEKEMALRI